MKTVVRLLFWCAVLGALVLLFYCLSPVEAQALCDGETVLTLLTPEGPETLTMAEYLPRAVAAEMPVSFGPEALKAQAVAARTYVLSAAHHEEGDICTDSGCCLAYKSPGQLREDWGGAYEANMDAVERAVTATDGQYLAYDGAAIQAVFHASSAGSTEDSANLWSGRPYLVSVASPETAGTVPGLVTTVRFSPAALAAALDLSPAGEPETWLGETVLDSAGRVESAALCGTEFSGEALRSALGLASTDFTAAWDGSEFVFSVRGSGHGVGMSQYGAKLLAAEGWSYEEILAHYYPGTELVRP